MPTYGLPELNGEKRVSTMSAVSIIRVYIAIILTLNPVTNREVLAKLSNVIWQCGRSKKHFYKQN